MSIIINSDDAYFNLSIKTLSASWTLSSKTAAEFYDIKSVIGISHIIRLMAFYPESKKVILCAPRLVCFLTGSLSARVMVIANTLAISEIDWRIKKYLQEGSRDVAPCSVLNTSGVLSRWRCLSYHQRMRIQQMMQESPARLTKKDYEYRRRVMKKLKLRSGFELLMMLLVDKLIDQQHNLKRDETLFWQKSFDAYFINSLSGAELSIDFYDL